MTSAHNTRDHWPRHALQWSLVGPPLRPSEDDVALAMAEVQSWSARHGRPARVLLLGVTPELATMPLPPGATLHAVDRSPSMIAHIFPAKARARGVTAAVADWHQLPHIDGAFDLVLGDGCLTCGRFPEDYRKVAVEARRVLVAQGRMLMRLFTSPERAESLDDVARAVEQGTVHSFHALKWRIAMAIAPQTRNVAVTDIAVAFERLFPERSALSARTGWAIEEIATIDAYRGSDVVYSFPTEAETVASLQPELVVVERHAASYELGERCTRLSFRRG